MWCRRRGYTDNNKNKNKKYDENKRTYPPIPIFQCTGTDIKRYLSVKGRNDNDEYQHKEELHPYTRHINFSSEACVLRAVLICHERTASSLNDERNYIGGHEPFCKPRSRDIECFLFRVEEVDEARDDHVCKRIYPWNYIVRTQLGLFKDGDVLHNGARRNNSVERVTYVEFC